MTENEFLEFARAAMSRAVTQEGRIGHLVLMPGKKLGEAVIREPEIRTAFQQQAEARQRLHGIEVRTGCRYQFSGKSRTTARVDFALFSESSAESQPGSLLERDVLVEFKEGQPEKVSGDAVSADNALPPALSPENMEDTEPGEAEKKPTHAIVKDLEKLWAERAQSGRCMLHICQAASRPASTQLESPPQSRTIKALMDKYTKAMLKAVKRGGETRGLYPDSACTDSDMGWLLLLILVLHPRDKDKEGAYFFWNTWNGEDWVQQGEGVL